MGSQAITAGIFGTIVLVLAFILYTPLVDSMDGLILYWSDSCNYQSERYVRVYVGQPAVSGTANNVYDTTEKKFYGSGGGVQASSAAGNCTFSEFAVSPTSAAPVGTSGTQSGQTAGVGAPTIDLYNERGQLVFTQVRGGRATGSALSNELATTVFPVGTVPAQQGRSVSTGGGAYTQDAITNIGTGHKWRAVPSLLTQFGGIGKLVLSVLPIVVLASYLGVAGMGLIQYGRGLSQGGIVNAVGGAIIQLIVYVVLLKILPVVMDAMIGSSSVTDGQYTVTGTFGSVINIVFAAAPILLVVALLGTSGYMLYSKSKSFRGSGAMSGMPSM